MVTVMIADYMIDMEITTSNIQMRLFLLLLWLDNGQRCPLLLPNIYIFQK